MTTQDVLGWTWTQGGARQRSTEFYRWNQTLQAVVETVQMAAINREKTRCGAGVDGGRSDW